MAMKRNEAVGSSSSSPSKKTSNNAKQQSSPPPQLPFSVPKMSTGNNGNKLPICIVDNGGWTVKFGLLPPTTTTTIPTMSSMYNATARPPHQLTVLSGDEITLHMKNLGQLSWKYSMERGMICDGETQLRVWNRVLENVGVIPKPSGGAGFLGTISSTATRRGKQPSATATAAKPRNICSSNDCTFLLLEPPFAPSVISEGVDCILFRELGLGRVARLLGPCMAAIQYTSFCQSMPTMTYPPNDDASPSSLLSPPSSESSLWVNDNTNCCCVVDSGYSFTHIVPTHQSGTAIINAIRRLDIGGKVLTNLLKEYVTYRQWNMMDEYHIVNDVKEQLCFVTDQFDIEMTKARNIRKGMRWYDREYLLPDFVHTFRGSVRLPEPLQRKRELEEMEKMQLELERGDKERERRELAEEARELQDEANEAVETDKNGATGRRDTNGSKTIKADNVKSKKPAKKQKNRRSRKVGSSNADVTEDDGDGDIIMEDINSDTDSEDETDQQRLHRLKAMRDAERKRREQESLERQALAMSVERFAIPEVLFRPSDIGLDCGGIVEAIVESISACPSTVRAAMYHNILLVGGNAKIPGFYARVEKELRKLAPSNYEVRVFLPDDPVSYAWEGAKQFAQRPGFQEKFSIDRASWETLKKAGKNQHEIWGNKTMTS